MGSIDVVLEYFDNTDARVICEPSIAQELSEFFTFEVPGAQFSPHYRNKYWDVKIRLFNLKKFTIYAGLVSHVVEFCKLSGYTYDNKTKYIGTDVVKPDFINTLDLPKAIETRDYQKVAFAYAMTKKRTVIISPTASGKSLMIYTMARYLLSQGKQQGLLIVPTISLVEQMAGDFKSYGWDVEKNCQKIYQGQEKAPIAPLVISTWQSIYDMPKKYFAQFDFVIGDEAHTFKAKSLTSIMTNLIHCDYRIGTTGTLDGTKVNKLVLEGLFGPSKKIVSTKELIDQKFLSKFKIECLVLKYPEAVCKEIKGSTYPEEMDFLVGNEARNNFICNLAGGLQGNTLILYTYVDKHGKVIFDLLQQKKYNRKMFFVCGDTDVMDREDVRHITEKENDAIIVASYGTFSTGINIRNLHNIIFASPTKSRVRSLQSIGRGLRLGDNKEEAVLYDIADDLRYKTYTNFTLNHYEERVKMYIEERFPFKTHNIGITQ